MIRQYGEGLDPAMLRGNVPTRVQKCRRGDYAAVIIAAAGVARLKLDLSGLVVYDMLPEVWIPAPGQAALGIEIRKDDNRARAAVSPIEDAECRRCAGIERELLHRFEGGCHEAFGAWARRENGTTVVRLGHEDAKGRWRSAEASGDDATVLVDEAFRKLRAVMESDAVDTREGEMCRRRSS
jgi:porphobilinogen deaminase